MEIYEGAIAKKPKNTVYVIQVVKTEVQTVEKESTKYVCLTVISNNSEANTSAIIIAV